MLVPSYLARLDPLVPLFTSFYSPLPTIQGNLFNEPSRRKYLSAPSAPSRFSCCEPASPVRRYFCLTFYQERGLQLPGLGGGIYFYLCREGAASPLSSQRWWNCVLGAVLSVTKVKVGSPTARLLCSSPPLHSPPSTGPTSKRAKEGTYQTLQPLYIYFSLIPYLPNPQPLIP